MKAFHFRPSTHTVFGYASYAMIPGLNQLTLEEKVGQVVCFGWSPVDGQDAASVNQHARALVEEMHVGSVVLMGRSVVDPQQTRQMLDELQSLSRIPFSSQSIKRVESLIVSNRLCTRFLETWLLAQLPWKIRSWRLS